uniref:Nodule-specific cysteine-rich peptide L46 n=1 Tax=Lens culinaris TaxID=3864 RepID=A0A7T8IG86_LENCU|nr:nodule-specific cysteine-rich peptide L46 [Lens culinaris]
MAETIQLVFYIILFNFLLLVVTDVSAGGKMTQPKCHRNSDCPRNLCWPPLVAICDLHKCFCRPQHVNLVVRD